MTRILCTGSPTRARLNKILDAAVERLGLTEVAVIAGDDCDDMVTAWNDRRWPLYRFYSEPQGVDVHLIFPGYEGARYGNRIIEVKG